MSYPKIKSARAIDNHTLLVEFDNQERKWYDITPLLNREMFAPLHNPAFFKNVQVEKSGHAVYTNFGARAKPSRQTNSKTLICYRHKNES